MPYSQRCSDYNICATAAKKDKFCDFLLDLRQAKPLLKSGIKRKIAPSRSKFIPCRVDPFKEGYKTVCEKAYRASSDLSYVIKSVMRLEIPFILLPVHVLSIIFENI